ncbi:MAG TPA: class I SAM-dependent methyltransferase [Pseudonocardiaceae bacterium]|nr:class I SAM-dependent methyltransferase [Pseudonocardiaceae bacterium]
MTEVVPDETGRAAHDSQRALPVGVSGPLYARLAGELGTGPVLDVGAGSGVVSTELARAGAELVLTDVVDWRAPIAAGLPFALADAAALPIGTGSCGGVHLARVLHHVADWRAVLAETARVLRADGTLCLSLGDRPVFDRLRTLVDRAAELTGLTEAPVAGPDQASADLCLAQLGLARGQAFEFGADVAVTPRTVLTGALGNPFRWLPGQDLAVVPKIVTEVLAEAGVDPDTPVLRDRTVRYRTYRRAG